MKPGIQTLLAEAGEAGCLALCICEAGRPGITEGEAISLIMEGIHRDWISYDERTRDNPMNFFVKNRDAFMDLVTGERGWYSSIEKPEYQPRQGEKAIECWIWEEPSKTGSILHRHFKLKDWDPILNSRTIQNGKLESYRVFRRKT